MHSCMFFTISKMEERKSIALMWLDFPCSNDEYSHCKRIPMLHDKKENGQTWMFPFETPTLGKERQQKKSDCWILCKTITFFSHKWETGLGAYRQE